MVLVQQVQGDQQEKFSSGGQMEHRALLLHLLFLYSSSVCCLSVACNKNTMPHKRRQELLSITHTHTHTAAPPTNPSVTLLRAQLRPPPPFHRRPQGVVANTVAWGSRDRTKSSRDSRGHQDTARETTATYWPQVTFQRSSLRVSARPVRNRE